MSLNNGLGDLHITANTAKPANSKPARTRSDDSWNDDSALGTSSGDGERPVQRFQTPHSTPTAESALNFQPLSSAPAKDSTPITDAVVGNGCNGHFPPASNGADPKEADELSECSTATTTGGGGAEDQLGPLEAALTFRPKRTASMATRMHEIDSDRALYSQDGAKEELPVILQLKDSTLKETLHSRLDTFRRNRELCDCVLFVREREILAHRVVLASLSPALYDMFVAEDGADGGQQQRTESEAPTPVDESQLKAAKSPPSAPKMSFYEFAQGDYECFEALVNFAYTSRMQVPSRKVADLYKTAYALKVYAVAQACAKYLAENLSISNCIRIRKQANFNDDSFLVSRVDSFIVANFERVVADSVEFSQLPCIRSRIILPHGQFHTASDGNGSEHQGAMGLELALKCLDYFQKLPRVSDRIDQQIEALVEKSHLLYAASETWELADCAHMDDRSSVGGSEIVQDYKRSSSKSKPKRASSPPSHHNGVVQHHIAGALPVKINASRVTNAQYASNESLTESTGDGSATTGGADGEGEIESRLIAVNETSSAGGFWTCLAVLHRRLVVLSMQLSQRDEISPETTVRVEVPGIVIESIKVVAETTDVRTTGTEKKLVPLPPMSRARCSIGANYLPSTRSIIIFGGYDRGECISTAEEYSLVARQWRQLPSMSSERGRLDSAVLDGRIWAIGGSNGNVDLKSCEAYEPPAEEGGDGKWAKMPELPGEARSQNGCASLAGAIYCIGGTSERKVLKACDRYDPGTDAWSPVAPLQTARYQSGCCTWSGLIVCCGGSDKWACLDTVEAYDPKTDSWRYLAKLNAPRRGCAVAVMAGRLYVIGGHDGQQSLSSVETLDSPEAEHWLPGPSLCTPRANTHAVVVGGREGNGAGEVIYVIGGFDGKQFLASMEMLEQESPSWKSTYQPSTFNGNDGNGRNKDADAQRVHFT